MVVRPPLLTPTNYHDRGSVARDADGGSVVPPASSEEGGDGDTAGDTPHRVRPRGAVHVPVPAHRGGEGGPGRHRARRDARGGHCPLPGGGGSLRGRRGEVIISHADVDHCGGNRALREINPSLRFSCGGADRAWVESN